MESLRKRITSLSIFPTSSPSHPINNNVFLSFRGEDTRKSFTDHLYNALKLAGVQVFIDNNGLQRGQEISPGLRKGIQEAKVCIVVFSKNYAASRWCLDELLEILECKEKSELIVLPVFYNVDPSYIRHQKVSSTDAVFSYELLKRFRMCFSADEQREKAKVEMWRNALCEAANISGYCLDNDANGHEAILIEKIVTDVLHVIDPIENVKKFQIFEEIKSRLSLVNIENNVNVTGMMRVARKTVVSSNIAGVVAQTIVPCGFLGATATTLAANVVVDKVSNMLKFEI